MENNKYLEEFKIDLVKQHLQGKQKKTSAKNTGSRNQRCGMDMQYAGLIQKSWEVKGIEAAEEEYIEITMSLKEERNSKTIINTTNESVRIFKNGYLILCHVSKLGRVMRAINDD